MRRLLLADVHANLPALEAAVEAAGPADETWFLGDVVGCGPFPAECVERLIELAPLAVIGNHDEAVLARATGSPLAGTDDWDAWTAARLPPAHLAFLRSLPRQQSVSCCGQRTVLVHQTQAGFYLHPAMPNQTLARGFAGIDAPQVCCGHSHRLIDRCVDGRRLVCLPPVGQPRDRDPRAGYAIETQAGLTFHRVEYDVEATVSALGGVGLPPESLARWQAFVRRGWDAEWSRDWPADAPHAENRSPA